MNQSHRKRRLKKSTANLQIYHGVNSLMIARNADENQSKDQNRRAPANVDSEINEFSIRNAFRSLDADDSGLVDFDEYARLPTLFSDILHFGDVTEEEQQLQMKQAFMQADDDQSGALDFQEFRTSLTARKAYDVGSIRKEFMNAMDESSGVINSEDQLQTMCDKLGFGYNLDLKQWALDRGLSESNPLSIQDTLGDLFGYSTVNDEEWAENPDSQGLRISQSELHNVKIRVQKYNQTSVAWKNQPDSVSLAQAEQALSSQIQDLTELSESRKEKLKRELQAQLRALFNDSNDSVKKHFCIRVISRKLSQIDESKKPEKTTAETRASLMKKLKIARSMDESERSRASAGSDGLFSVVGGQQSSNAVGSASLSVDDMSVDPTSENLALLFDLLDEDDSQLLDFQEFSHCGRLLGLNSALVLRQAFNDCDADRSGLIDFDEFKQIRRYLP